MNRCAVTGATGYVGTRVSRCFRSGGWEVLELARNSQNGTTSAYYRLDAEIPPKVLDGVDTLIHCAYDFGVRKPAIAQEINIRGSVRLFRAALAAGIRRVIFISSMAAYENCKSTYGSTKRAIEREAEALNMIV